MEKLTAYIFNQKAYFYLEKKGYVKIYFEYDIVRNIWSIVRRYQTYFDDIKYEIKKYNDYPNKEDLIHALFTTEEEI